MQPACDTWRSADQRSISAVVRPVASCPLVARRCCRMPCDGRQPVGDALQLHRCLHVLPAIGLPLRAGCCRRHSADNGWAAAGDPFSFRGSCRLWARSQWTKAIDGDAAAHERKSPHGVNLCGLSKGGQSMRIAAIAIRSTESFPARRSACRQTLQCTALQNHQT